jgi:predicted phage tail protein
VQIGQVTVSLGTTAYVGLAVSSQNPKATATAAFSQVAIIRNNLPAGQQAVDIGAPAIPGSTTFSGGSYRMHAGGSDIGGVADQFQYLYQSVTGDTDVTVRVASQTNSSALAKAGVMFRASLAANAANVALLTTPTSGYLFQRRAASGDSTASSAAGTGTAPVWLRLKRTGSLFTAYRSTDGNTWTVISSDSITMADPIYVGIAATSHSATLASDVTADNFSVAAAQAADLPPSVTLTAPANGASFTAPASISITATASDPENQLSRVDFYNGSTLLGSATTAPYSYTWSNAGAGTYSLTAMAYDASGQSTQSAPASVTVSQANQPPAVSLTAPANGASYTAPASITISATASDPENQLTRVDFYNGSTLLGSATAAPYSFTWSNVAAGTYSLSATARDAAGLTALSAAVSVTVTTANQPPTVSLTAPANGATFTAPASITISANASDPENQLTRVDFYNGSTLLGSDTTAPYSFSWSNVAAGTYSLSAIARDAAGLTKQSTAVSVTVSPANRPPTVSLTSPASGASFGAPASITISANASDPENQLTRVDFYNGSTLLGSDTTAPYSFAWSNVPAGTYSLNAVARDAAGLSTQSVSVSVTVSAVTAPPTGVIFQASVDHATVTSYRVEVFAAGANPNTATPIATQDIGKPAPNASNDISVSIPSLFSALAAGNYQLTVAAVSGTQFTRSTALAFTK